MGCEMFGYFVFGRPWRQFESATPHSHHSTLVRKSVQQRKQNREGGNQNHGFLFLDKIQNARKCYVCRNERKELDSSLIKSYQPKAEIAQSGRAAVKKMPGSLDLPIMGCEDSGYFGGAGCLWFNSRFPHWKAMVKSCGMKLLSDRLRREELLRYSISKSLFPFDLLVVITWNSILKGL